MRGWLPEGHLAWRIITLTAGMDLSAMRGAYRADGQGQAPYDPAMMLALILYCLFKGRTSSREMAGSCVDDVGCRVICGGGGPSHKTIAEFRRRHRDAIRDLFGQVLAIMAAEGAIGGHCAAVDGSPVSGNASRFANLTAGQLDERITETEEKLAAAAAEWLDGACARPPLDDGADRGDGDGDEDDAGPGGMPRRIGVLQSKLARLKQARARAGEKAAAPGGPAAAAAAARDKAVKAQARLEEAEARQDALVAEYEAVIAAGGKWRRGRVPVPKERHEKTALKRRRARDAWDRARAAEAKAAQWLTEKVKANPSDPGTLLIPAKNGGGWIQGWNLQLAAARSQVLLYVALHDSPVDSGALVPVIREALAFLARAATRPGAASLRDLVRAWLADAGYASGAAFEELADLLLLVAVKNEAAQQGRAGGGRDTPEAWKPMESRLATPAGKALYKRRAAQVEPAFAQYFARFGRVFRYRGRDAVEAEAILYGTVHNIAKLFTHRDRTARSTRQGGRARAAPAPA
jgi:transposase